MLQVKPVNGGSLASCRKFLSLEPAANVLVLGDCYWPLREASTLYCACEGSQVVGVCSVFHGFSKPSVALGAATAETKRVLLGTALRDVQDEFISIVPTAEFELLKEHASVVQLHDEQQMIASKPRQIEGMTKAVRVPKNAFHEIDEFYTRQCLPGWIPLQFKVGPVYCVRQAGKTVSAAGVHIGTPQIAHLGNIATDKAYRNRGFGSACTSALANHLSAGGRMVSLYVKTGNNAAIHLYEKLGFKKTRDVVFATMKKHA